MVAVGMVGRATANAESLGNKKMMIEVNFACGV